MNTVVQEQVRRRLELVMRESEALERVLEKLLEDVAPLAEGLAESLVDSVRRGNIAARFEAVKELHTRGAVNMDAEIYLLVRYITAPPAAGDREELVKRLRELLARSS